MQKSNMILAILLLFLIIILPTSLIINTITNIINPNTAIRPEWILEITYLKISLALLGLTIIFISITNPSFKTKEDQGKKEPYKFQKLIFIIVLLSIIFGSYFAFRSIEINVGSIIIDDFFYYLNTAKHIQSNGIMSFDGTNVTNGFHPLWMLIIVILTALIKSNLLLIKVIGFIIACIHAATAYFLYRILRHYKYETAGIILAIFWAFNPFILWMNLGGLETGLNLLFIAITFLFYTTNRNALSTKKSITLGLLLGISFLSRLDSVFFCLGIAFDYLFFREKVNLKNLKKSFLELIPCGIILIIIAGSWLLVSYSFSGEMFPASGSAKTLTNNVNYYSSIADFAIKRVFTILAISNQATYTIGFWYLPGLVLSSTILLITFIIICWLIHKIKISIKPAISFVLISIVLATYYLLTSIDIRYLFPIIMFYAVGLTIVLAKSYEMSSSKKKWRNIFIVLLVFLVINITIGAILEGRQLSGEWNPLADTMYDEGIAWIDSTPEGTIIGSFNAGSYGYFSHRKVVNLDGVINSNAYYAMRDNKLYDYLREQNITYVIDWEYVREFYFERFGGDVNTKFDDNLELVHTIYKKDEPHKGLRILIYKVKYEKE